MINTSGLRPCGRAVLLAPYNAAVTTSLIELPEEVIAREQMTEQRAVVVAIGKVCWHDEPEPRCQVGDRVIVAKYSGYQAQGIDKAQYRFVNDRDIFAVIEGDDGHVS